MPENEQNKPIFDIKAYSGLCPRLIDELDSMLNELKARGIAVNIYSGLRTWEEQDKLYALGRTRKNPDGITTSKPMGNIVTNAHGGQSWHNFGLAVDIAFLNSKGNVFWPGDADKRWTELGKLGEAFGLEWGGNWKFKDLPHFQMRGKIRTLENAQRLYKIGGTVEVWKAL